MEPMEKPLEKKLRRLSPADSFDDIAGRNVYSRDGAYMGMIVGEGYLCWLLDGGGKIHKPGSPNFCIEI